MFNVEMNKLKDYVRVKNPSTGAWEKAAFQYVSNDSPNDIIEVDSEAQELQNKVAVLKAQVAEAIVEMKQKKEVLELGGCDSSEYDKKVSHYKLLKTAYEEAKMLVK